ncbi:hypothetical protein FACS1894162_5060 [Bacteroidia bacterium]|nr:hypothetical protein FACS1894162_5060 [Bacteroidia bacterium]
MKKLLLLICLLSCILPVKAQPAVIVGAEQTEQYLPLLQNKRVALFSNHTGKVGDKHLLDVLIENKVNVTAIFSPEHGFRGDAGAGDHVSSSVDAKTGVPILSLYEGTTGKPSADAPNPAYCFIFFIFILV